MIITKNFIVLNLPKTGSTFTRNVLKKLYGVDKRSIIEKVLYKFKLVTPEFQELILPNIKMPNRVPDQHGTYLQIPKKYKNRILMSTIRNPYSRFLSGYKFRAWANPNQLEVSKSIIEENWPKFPNLNIDEYVDLNILAEKIRLSNTTGQDNFNENEIGNQTIQFVQMFFKNPNLAIERLNDDYINSGEFKNDIADIIFLRQENLNHDLINFLLEQGFSQEKLEFIKNTERLNKTNYDSEKIDDIWTQNAIDYVSYRERYLLEILHHFDIEYNKPSLN